LTGGEGICADCVSDEISHAVKFFGKCVSVKKEEAQPAGIRVDERTIKQEEKEMEEEMIWQEPCIYVRRRLEI
jgi:hypothetical protein